jgi:hypothetical protein
VQQDVQIKNRQKSLPSDGKNDLADLKTAASHMNIDK